MCEREREMVVARAALSWVWMAGIRVGRESCMSSFLILNFFLKILN